MYIIISMLFVSQYFVRDVNIFTLKVNTQNSPLMQMKEASENC